MDKMDTLARRRAQAESGELHPYVLETQAKWEARQGRIARAQEDVDEAVRLVPPENKALRDELLQSRQALSKTQP